MSDPRVADDLTVGAAAGQGPRRDRHFAEPLTLEDLAAVAMVSKDLLRTTNLTVTEVCHAVGYSSLGSFSSGFAAVTGESPSAFQARWAHDGAPRIPGC